MNKLYIQHSSYEPNEFDFFDRISTYEILSHFEKYPWSDENEKIKNLKEQSASPSLTIMNSIGDEIVIYVYGDENLKFNCQYRLKQGIVKRTKIALAFDSIEINDLIGKFCNDSRKDDYLKILESKEIVNYKLFADILASILPNKKKEKSRLSSNTETTFQITNWRMISKSFFTISFLLMAPVIMGLVYINTGKEFNLKPFLFLQFVLSIPAIPGFLILMSYLKENRTMILKFKRRNNYFTVIQNDKVVEFDKGEIEKVICYESSAGNAPWTSFDYAEINLKNGEKIYFTNLLISNDKLMNYISNVEYEFKKKWIPRIKY
ncbi:MAG: hypothetical protein JEY97_06330 [Bacteroidales bacterium]|nr:hypothetical protein [Bacteroidales bacterium]